MPRPNLAFTVTAFASLLNAGCLYGSVSDADTTTLISGVTIVADGNCSGAGCGVPIQQLTDGSGRFVFDAYGNVNGASGVQVVSSKSGEEAVKLTFSKSGYQSQVVFHTPKYVTVTSEGKDYSVSEVQTVYLCKTGTADSDGDGVCNAAEQRYGTNALAADTDGDSIDDGAELFGSGGVDLRGKGANARRRDVFVEVDWYPGLKPLAASMDRVVAAFAAAPVANDDGSTGISLHLVMSNQVAAADADLDLNPVWAQYDVVKAKYFPARRAPFFHYLLVANRYDGNGSSGRSRGIPGHDFLMTMGTWSTPGGTEQQQAGTLMHELGHNLGLEHGGNEAANSKPNYLSIMSYAYQLGGLTVNGTAGTVDYSRLRIASVSESSLSEGNAFAPLAPTTEAMLAQYRVRIGGVFRTGTASANLDINGNGSIQAGTISYDLSGDGDTSDTFSASQNDWPALLFDGAGQIGGPGAAAGLARGPLFIRTPELSPTCATE